MLRKICNGCDKVLTDADGAQQEITVHVHVERGDRTGAAEDTAHTCGDDTCTKKAAEQAANKLDYGWPVTTIQRMYKILPEEAFADLDAFADAQEAQYKAAYEAMGGDDSPAGVGELSDEEIMRMLGEM